LKYFINLKEDQRKKIGSANKTMVEAKFNKTKIIQQYIDLLEN